MAMVALLTDMGLLENITLSCWTNPFVHLLVASRKNLKWHNDRPTVRRLMKHFLSGVGVVKSVSTHPAC